MAQSLQALGHKVTVLTGFPNWPSGKVYPGYRIKPWQRETLDGVQLVRVALYPDHSRSGFKRMLNYLSFALSATILGPVLLKRTDVIHVIPPVTAAIPAWVLSRVWGAPFTHEIQDLWPETLAATGMINNRRILAIVGVFAKWVYRRAAAIRVISPGFKTNLVQHGVAAEKIHIISNWVDTTVYRPTEPNRERSGSVDCAERFTVMYAGTIGPAQGLETVVEAARLLRNLPLVKLVMVGEGLDRTRLEHAARRHNLDNIEFVGRQPSKDMPRIYALADVLLVHLRNDPLFRVTIPHKVLTYMASGKPVLAAVDGDAAAVIASSRSGLTCPPGDPRALADTIRRLYGMSPEERAALGANGRRTSCEEYGREPLVARIAAMLENVAGDRQSTHHGAA